MTASAATLEPSRPGMPFNQFVALIAALMAVNALAIDSMLPALPIIGRAVGIVGSNQQQWIITSYLLGFGGAQILYGTLADRFGRKPVLMTGLVIYGLCSLVAAFSATLPMLIVARVLQGIGAAATRVLAVSIVRDCFTGAQMARVMSLAYIVFMTVPILAPSVGQIIMLFGPWRWIFGCLALFGFSLVLWCGLRLPETLHADDRLPIAPSRILKAFRLSLTNRIAVGYMLAMTLMMGALFGFINSSQQIFADAFAAPRAFTTIFALIAAFMALSSFVNARIVGRIGPRRVAHVALVGLIGTTVAHAAIAVSGHETIWVFTVLQSITMFWFGLVLSNCGAIAMGPLGHIAGTASSVQGFVTTFGGALLAFIIGQRFDGTAIPLTVGFAVCATAAFAVIALAERGRLFRLAPMPADAERAAH